MANEVAPSEMFFESVVQPEFEGEPLLFALSERFTYHSVGEWRQKIFDGDVLLNGELPSETSAVHRGDKVRYRVRGYKEPEVDTSFAVIFEDDEFLLVQKPAGIPVHHTGRIFFNTFTGVLRRAFGNGELTPMHRLDRDTGGLMLFAKTSDTAARFQRHLERILLRKFYLAVVPGEFPESYDCNIPLAERKESAIRSQMFPEPGGKVCRTLFRRLKLFEATFGENSGRFSLVEAELLTGRKHQIRAHLAALGFPILGDRIYSHGGAFYLKLAKGPLSAGDYAKLGAKFQMLFAYKVVLELPYWNEPRTFEVPPLESWHL